MAQLDTNPCAWKNKVNATDTFVFGGDIAAGAGNPASWSGGAQSIHRVAALAATDYLELDFTYDARSAGHGIGIGFASQYIAPVSPSPAALAASIWWDTDNTLKAYEGGSLRNSQAGLAIPLSCRIIYNAGVLTWRRNAGSDILFFTSARTTDQIMAEMVQGLQVMVFFFNNSGQLHVTLKGGDADTPEVGFTPPGTGRLGIPTLTAEGFDMTSYNRAMFRNLNAVGFPESTNPRPTVGKIWPRKR
jgi:hypothetical protein